MLEEKCENQLITNNQMKKVRKWTNKHYSLRSARKDSLRIKASMLKGLRMACKHRLRS